jgi:hypothetical protein
LSLEQKAEADGKEPGREPVDFRVELAGDVLGVALNEVAEHLPFFGLRHVADALRDVAPPGLRPDLLLGTLFDLEPLDLLVGGVVEEVLDSFTLSISRPGQKLAVGAPADLGDEVGSVLAEIEQRGALFDGRVGAKHEILRSLDRGYPCDLPRAKDLSSVVPGARGSIQKTRRDVLETTARIH